MTYIISDIHGQYGKYMKMLEKINFSDDDELFVLGDIIDRGENPIKVLTDMSMRENVFPILGNHELMAIRILKKLCVEITEENYAKQLDINTLMGLNLWQLDGGDTTLKEFKALDKEEKFAIIDYISDFSHYDELTVNGKKFILVHGGIPYEKKDIPLYEQDIKELVTERPDYNKVYFKDKFLVTGHTPTQNISPDLGGRILIQNNHIAIDCGAGFGGPLGCLRLNDFNEYYVE